MAAIWCPPMLRLKASLSLIFVPRDIQYAYKRAIGQDLVAGNVVVAIGERHIQQKFKPLNMHDHHVQMTCPITEEFVHFMQDTNDRYLTLSWILFAMQQAQAYDLTVNFEDP